MLSLCSNPVYRFMLALLEVAVRVWCRVAAGVEVVVEVFFEAGELGWIS